MDCRAHILFTDHSSIITAIHIGTQNQKFQKFTCLECCINRHNGHTLLTIRDLESNQLKAISELRDARRKIIEASQSFDIRLSQIGIKGHAAAVAAQKKVLFYFDKMTLII